ncbi:MAG: hypothetical protein AB1492_00820 [Bacillota bacterium]
MLTAGGDGWWKAGAGGSTYVSSPFSPVNRSVWEQLKGIFWPILGWVLVEQVFVWPKPPAFWPANKHGRVIYGGA